MQELKILSVEEKLNLDIPRISKEVVGAEFQKKVYLESYGCQMNFADSEVVTAILIANGFGTTSNINEADAILLNTCAIRDNAELKIRNRLKGFSELKRKNPSLTIGILGCMAERLKIKLIEEEKLVDLVAGPDSYRDIPNLLLKLESEEKAINVFLSKEETYGDIEPVRLHSNGVTAFVSIMRGCDNMCSFCVVPFTRGRERSRDTASILHECKSLFNQGYREVTLLGQNVDSYKYKSAENTEVVNFASLLGQVAIINPLLRVRFSTSHPKDITDEVLMVISKYPNICKNVHLPAQSGSNRILKLMNRTYTREWYMGRINSIRTILGQDCGISHDMIAGFCTENETDHQDTLSLMDQVIYDFGYMFTYSERPGTPAEKKYQDDIEESIKQRRLSEIISKQRLHSGIKNNLLVGTIQHVLVEGDSKKSNLHHVGKCDSGKVVVFKKVKEQKGEYVNVRITHCTTGTLIGEIES